MWRGTDVLDNVLTCLLLGMAFEMHPIAYCEHRGSLTPSDPLDGGGGNLPPPQTPPTPPPSLRCIY